MEQIFTCTVCPFGCELHVDLSGAEPVVTGNACARGKKYGIAEATNPVRTLTSTVLIDGISELHPNLKLLPVKVDKPIPKAMMFDGMRIIKTIKVAPPVKAGDIVYKDFLIPGVNLVAGRNI